MWFAEACSVAGSCGLPAVVGGSLVTKPSSCLSVKTVAVDRGMRMRGALDENAWFEWTGSLRLRFDGAGGFGSATATPKCSKAHVRKGREDNRRITSSVLSQVLLAS